MDSNIFDGTGSKEIGLKSAIKAKSFVSLFARFIEEITLQINRIIREIEKMPRL